MQGADVVGLCDIAAWRYDVMATEPPSYLSSQCGYTLSSYLYMCGPFGYVYRAQHGRAKEPYGSSARSLCCASPTDVSKKPVRIT
jgi:hypothetical protein